MKKIPVTTTVLAVIVLVLFGSYLSFYVANGNLLSETLRVRALAVQAKSNTGRFSSSGMGSEEHADVSTYQVTEEQVPAFLADIEGRGRSVGAQITVASVEPEKSNNGKLRVTLSISGNFPAVMQTLGLIEYAPYGISTSAVTLSKSGTQWQADVVFTVLYASASASIKH